MSKNQELRSKKQAKKPVNPMQTDDLQSPSINNQLSELEERTADLQRLQAEFINYKNRVEAEKAALADFAKVQVIKDLLPVVDDLERALGHLPDSLKEDKWAHGAAKVYDRLKKQLAVMGVTEIEALNQAFDPNLHEAVQVEGEGDQQIVSEVLQSGYKIADLVVRHAIVKVTNR
ncbi:MAG: molecular chaperone GrpE [Patescibacteria group bacterium]|jgi:molecular chaperone GrpE|nr:molecular chaperone GrpE [Patescibacteria group bacterium]